MLINIVVIMASDGIQTTYRIGTISDYEILEYMFCSGPHSIVRVLTLEI